MRKKWLCGGPVVAQETLETSNLSKLSCGDLTLPYLTLPSYLLGRWLSLDRPSTGPHEPLLLGRADAGDAPLATDDALDRHAFVG